jgi:hypothetical protein
MCDRYSFEFGHICEECFAELCASTLTIEEFMRSPKIEVLTTYSRASEMDKTFPKREE